MYTFARMIEHEMSGAPYPFAPTGITLPAKFYKSFGLVMFIISIILEAVSLILILVFGIAAKLSIFYILILPLIIVLISTIISYITYYCRYRTFGNLLEVKSSNNLNSDVVQPLKKDNPNLLRGYCIFLFVVAIIMFIASIISLFFIGAYGILLIIAVIVRFFMLGVIGCYFDDLALMEEEYLLRFKKSHLSL